MASDQQIKSNVGLWKFVSQPLLFRSLGLAVVYLGQVVIARLMGAKGYGEYTVIFSVLNLLLVVSLSGFDTAILRFLPVALEKKEFGSAAGIVRFSYRVITIVSICCSIAIFLFLLSSSKKFNISFAEGVFWSVLLLPFLAIIYQASAILRALSKFKISLLPVYFLLPISISGVCLIYYQTNHKLPIDAAMLITLVCTIVVCMYVNRRAGKHLQDLIPLSEPESNSRVWMNVSAVLFLTTLLSMAMKQSDILMVGYFLGHAKAGIYGAASKISSIVALGLSVTDYVFMPKIAALWEKRELGKLQKGLRSASIQILIITVPLVLILVIFGKFLLGLFGKEFTNAYIPMIILMFGQLVNAATGMIGGLLTMTGHHRAFLLFYSIAVFIQLLLTSLLVNVIGLTGAAIGASVALIALNVSGFYFAKKRLGISASVF